MWKVGQYDVSGRTVRPTHSKYNRLPIEVHRAANTWPFLALAIGLAWSVWALVSIMIGGARSFAFAAEAGCFVLFAVAYVCLHGAKDMAWSSVPVLLTLEAVLGFAGLPVWRFITGADVLDATYTQAMFVVLVGFSGFWLGSLLFLKEAGIVFVPQAHGTPSRVTVTCGAMLLLGTAGDYALWKTGLFSYSADSQLRVSSYGFIQWMTFTSNLLLLALVVSGIEVIGKRSTETSIRLVFWLSLVLSFTFGLISGMKSGPLFPLVFVLLLYAITKRRIPRTALLLPVVLVVFIYPFVNAYRDNLNAGYRSQFNTPGGLEATLVQSFDDAFRNFGSAGTESQGKYSESATARLSYLAYVRDVVGLPAPAMLSGDEKLWLAPLYPLAPRFLWKDKPVLNKGQRLSILLGRGDQTSSAITPIADLYSMYGYAGVALGMFIWGVCLQLFMNWIGDRPVSEIGLFIYILMLRQLLNLEIDSVALIAGTVQITIEIHLLAWIIYGRSPFSSWDARHQTALAAQ
jgi:hypothetical protein